MKKAKQAPPKKAATASKSQISGGSEACAACSGAHRAHTCGKAVPKRAAPKHQKAAAKKASPKKQKTAEKKATPKKK